MEKVLYKRDNKGNPIQWSIYNRGNVICIEYGLVGKAGYKEEYVTDRKPALELKSRIDRKMKEGYVDLSSIYDNAPVSLSGEVLLSYLKSYLPKDNLNINGTIKPMLAKTFNYNTYANRKGQTKINGERATATYELEGDGFFQTERIKFRTKEGNELKVPTLESYLLANLPSSIFKKMRDEGYILDGEVYIPGYSINEINSACKNLSNPLNKFVQYWVYDLAIDNFSQEARLKILDSTLGKFKLSVTEPDLKARHLSNTNRLVLLDTIDIKNDDSAVKFRDLFIDAQFEGIILRDPNGEYQFGKRNSTMIKFKKIFDGWFVIKDIVPEGIKRSSLPKFICKNDLNNYTFECTIKGSFEDQEQYLKHRKDYIGKRLFVEYRERSGVNNVPFHAKGIRVKL